WNEWRIALQQFSSSEAELQILRSSQSLSIDDFKGKILIAEDVAMNAVLITSILKSYLPKAEIVVAKNGRVAIDLVHQIYPDLLFMDVQMPEMDGIQATHYIRTEMGDYG
ncbi:response regulator, partial [Arthrospira platensis SPKY2]